MKQYKTEEVALLRDMLKSNPDTTDRELAEKTGLARSTIKKHRSSMGLERTQTRAPARVLKRGVEERIEHLLKTSKLSTDEIAKRCEVSTTTVQRRARKIGIDMARRAKSIQKQPYPIDKLDQGMCGELSRYWLGRVWRTV